MIFSCFLFFWNHRCDGYMWLCAQMCVRQEFPVRGLYTQAGLLAHDCIGNTFITVDSNKQLKVFASADIQSGETIFNNYTATLYVSLADNYFM